MNSGLVETLERRKQEIEAEELLSHTQKLVNKILDDLAELKKYLDEKQSRLIAWEAQRIAGLECGLVEPGRRGHGRFITNDPI